MVTTKQVVLHSDLVSDLVHLCAFEAWTTTRVTMVHRAQDTRLLIALLKAEKDYSACLTGLLTASQASFAALSAYGASCPPGQAQAVTNVIGALTGAEDALRKYAGVVDGWRGHLKQVKKSEEEVASILRDREILYVSPFSTIDVRGCV